MTNSHHNRLDALSLRVLRVLFELARHDHRAHIGALARELDVGRTLVAEALRRLDRAGLVRAEHVRLTMAGLVAAQRLAPLTLRAPALVQDGKQSVRASRGQEVLRPHWLRATGS